MSADQFTPKDAHIGRFQFVGKVDVPLRLVDLSRPLCRIGLAQSFRGAKIGDRDIQCRKVGNRLS